MRRGRTSDDGEVNGRFGAPNVGDSGMGMRNQNQEQHDASGSDREVCKYLKENRCQFGQRCRNWHPNNDQI